LLEAFSDTLVLGLLLQNGEDGRERNELAAVR
jgi:hypothetical protein